MDVYQYVLHGKLMHDACVQLSKSYLYSRLAAFLKATTFWASLFFSGNFCLISRQCLLQRMVELKQKLPEKNQNARNVVAIRWAACLLQKLTLECKHHALVHHAIHTGVHPLQQTLPIIIPKIARTVITIRNAAILLQKLTLECKHHALVHLAIHTGLHSLQQTLPIIIPIIARKK